MSDPWEIRVYEDEVLRFTAEIIGPTELGRQLTPSEKLYSAVPIAFGQRLVITQDFSVNRRFALIEPLPGGCRITNLCNNRPIGLDDNRRLEPGERCTVFNNAILRVGRNTVLRLQQQDDVKRQSPTDSTGQTSPETAVVPSRPAYLIGANQSFLSPRPSTHSSVLMLNLFLSYRREDSQDIAGRINDSLVQQFGEGKVFMDVDSIPFGVDFRNYLSECVAGCDVFLAVIGKEWIGACHTSGPNVGKRRLDDPGDFVRIEIAAALAREIPVIPILVGGAAMPTADQLPPDIANLAYRNGAEVGSGRDFHSNVKQLIRGIEKLLQSPPDVRSETHELNHLQADAATLTKKTPSQSITAPANDHDVTWPTNLSFDGPVRDGFPVGWFNSSGHVGNVSIAYAVKVLTRPGNPVGRCVQLIRNGAEPGEFGSLMQRWFAQSLAGKIIRLEAELRTDDLDAWAGLWLRVDGRDQQLYFDNMHDRPIRGTTPWTKYTIETVAPSGTTWINYGILLVGNGTLWADNFQVSVVDHG